MTDAITQASDASHGAITKRPLFSRSVTKRTSGTTANGSCIDTSTWLKTSSLAVPSEPQSPVMMTTGPNPMTRGTETTGEGCGGDTAGQYGMLCWGAVRVK